jgi:hypothetical protein
VIVEQNGANTAASKVEEVPMDKNTDDSNTSTINEKEGLEKSGDFAAAAPNELDEKDSSENKDISESEEDEHPKGLRLTVITVRFISVSHIRPLF